MIEGFETHDSADPPDSKTLLPRDDLGAGHGFSLVSVEVSIWFHRIRKFRNAISIGGEQLTAVYSNFFTQDKNSSQAFFLVPVL